MFCKSCGANIADNAKFCKNCGEIIEHNNQQIPVGVYDDPYENKATSNKKMIAIFASMAALVLLIIGLIFIIIKTGNKDTSTIPIESFIDDTSVDENKWAKYTAEIEEWIGDRDVQAENLILSEENQKAYQTLKDDLEDMMENHAKKAEIKAKRQEIEEFLDKVKEENKEMLANRVSELKASNLDYATADDTKRISELEAKIDNLVQEGKYAEAKKLVEEWNVIVVDAATDFSAYRLCVRQHDMSEYPRIKLYLEVEDSAGNFVDNLGPEAFYINEGRKIDGEFNRAVMVKAAKLNQNEGISIGLVADVSGSMDGHMDEAKNAMKNFMGSVQFPKGDEIEIVEFSDDAYVCQSFTNDMSQINYSIDSMEPYGSTRLYDTLINEVARISSRSNAKCIIGFTDGYDNMSVNTAKDVVESANRYNIPVFLIGIGHDCDDDSLRYIAESTGGVYRNVNQVSDLNEIYNSIYTEQKEVYLIEYEIYDSDNLADPFISNICVRTKDGKGGKIEGYAIEPEDFFSSLYTRFLVAGIDCQTKGERNLIDSGLIIKNEEAFKDKNSVAAQCQRSIDNGGVGTPNARIFEVLVDYDVESIIRDGDGYILYGRSTYNVSKERAYSKANDEEKAKVYATYGNVSSSAVFWFEERITNYEKLKIVKDTDGQWKIYSRVYERISGDDPIIVEEVYRAEVMSY